MQRRKHKPIFEEMRMEEKTETINFLETMFETLEKTLPPIFARRHIAKLLGGSIASGTLANMGKDGPPYVRRGRNAIYEKSTFLKWLRAWLEASAE